MRAEPNPEPTWVVCSAGTGGTSATIGRFIRYQKLSTRLCVADPENSVFYDAWKTGRRDLTCCRGPGVEGIGRPRVEPSFIPTVIDECIQVPNAASFGAMHFLSGRLNRKVGGSTGTNLAAAARLIRRMLENGDNGSVVLLICDTGERYLNTYYNSDWLAANGYDIRPTIQDLTVLFDG
ncbi:MAG: pyridoxal-phosphate dependent enzyme [Tepidisphaeraceae bacterium]